MNHRRGLPAYRGGDIYAGADPASQLLRAGVNAKVVSERLGHSTVAFTLDVYGHLLPDMNETAAAAVDEKLGVLLNF